MSLANTLRTSTRSLAVNKLRLALTTLGVIIGVASVIAMLALGNGARAAVEASFRYLGSDQVEISAKRRLEDGEMVPVGEILSYEDGLGMVDEVELVKSVGMKVFKRGKVRRGRWVLDMGVQGVTVDALMSAENREEVQPVGWPEGVPLPTDAFLDRGRFFSQPEVLAATAVCVLGHETALDLFQGDDPIDQAIWVSRQRCRVIGVLAEVESVDPSQRQRSRPNQALYMPISSAIRMLYDEEPSVDITAYVVDESRIGQTKAEIASFLRQRHAIEPNSEGEYKDDFSMTTRQDILGAQQESARTFSLLLAAMAAISLIVGGIGIMNVMLVSVAERTREIGVRMAVGAQRRDIVAQFLCESVLLSSGGGLLGIALGIVSVPLAALLNQGRALLAPGSIPLAFSVAFLTGVLFGLYPAVRASRLDPIEALRGE